MSNLDKLAGETITDIEGLNLGSETVKIHTANFILEFFHWQGCCERVSIEDFELDNNLIGATVISAEEVTSDASVDVSESGTWTFYKIETSKGGLWMRWLGESNGYYSESVDIEIHRRGGE